MGRLTRQVLAQALEQCAAWHAAVHRVHVSVNVSVGDLLDPDFPDAVAALLSDAHPGAESLMLEVTETSIIDELERAKHAVDRFRHLGVRVSIDDFGAGFTLLAYLGHALGLDVVAEGVENDRALDLLRDLGCDPAPAARARRVRGSEQGDLLVLPAGR